MTTACIPAVPLAPVDQPQLLTGPFVRLLAVDLGSMTGFYLLLAVVPMYAAQQGIGGLGAGLTTAALMFASVGGELVTPRLAARIGWPRLLTAGVVLLGAPSFLLPTVDDLVSLLLVATVRGLGFAIVVTAVGAVAAVHLPVERRGEGLGVLGVASMLPAITALPAGVWLADRVGFTAVCAIGALAVLVVAPVAWGLPRAADRSAGDEAGLADLVRRPGTIAPACIFFVTAVAGGVVVTFLPAATAGSGSTAVAALALLAQALTATLSRYLGGRWADRRGPQILMVPGVAIAAAGMALAVMTASPVAVLVGMAAFGAGFGLVQTGSMNLMLRAASPSQYGAVSAAWNAAYDLGWGAGAAGIGLLVAGTGYPVAFAVTAALVAGVLPLAARSRVATTTPA
jgi:predicted MFS family arabinose efflux permease